MDSKDAQRLRYVDGRVWKYRSLTTGSKRNNSGRSSWRRWVILLVAAAAWVGVVFFVGTGAEVEGTFKAEYLLDDDTLRDGP